MNLLLSAPESLNPAHGLSEFDCGDLSLNDWLKRRALTNHLSGASRVFVVPDKSSSVFGYYAIAAGAISHHDSISATRRNMSDPISVILLSRLAVDRRTQGLKLGASLLRGAVTRAVSVSQNAGVRALLVHALNLQAKAFYEHYGFQTSPTNPMTLMLRLKVG
jgi:GNAT superfamily N-acetyltransferase